MIMTALPCHKARQWVPSRCLDHLASEINFCCRGFTVAEYYTSEGPRYSLTYNHPGGMNPEMFDSKLDGTYKYQDSKGANEGGD